MAASLALLLTGCNGGQGSKPQATKTPAPKSTEGGPNPAKPPVVEPHIPEGIFDQGQPGQGGWTTSKDKLVQLGREMDQAMRSGKPMLCQGMIYYTDPSIGKMQFESQARIQDDTHFHIEYVMPETGPSMNRMIGDGQRRVVRKQGKWIELSSFEKSANVDVDKTVSGFPRSFPEEMFAHFRDGSDVWAPLFDGWQRGLGGYKATFEEQKFKRAGQEVIQYRIKATTDKKPVTKIEMIVDKERSLPVTINVTGHLKDGRQYQLMWSAGWKFGGSYDAKVFEIPPPAPK